MTMISDLSWDLVEEILYRVPITSLGAMRSTCKGWRSISKDPSYTKKHYGKAAKEYLVNKSWGNSFNCCGWYGKTPMKFSLHNIEDLPSTKEIGKIICPVDIYEVYQCDGLFLCVTMNKNPNLVVWNPYTSQTRLISHAGTAGACKYAIGYDNSNNHKVLRFFDISAKCVQLEIYDFESSSWRVLDVMINVDTPHRGVSLKGNTYFVCKKLGQMEFVICFDFTTERFGQRLSLPFISYGDVVPSRVREEQLAVLQLHHLIPHEVAIWITTTIEPNAVSWSKYFKVKSRNNLSMLHIRSFFIDNEKKVIVVCGRQRGEDIGKQETSYVIGEDVDYQKTSFIGEVSSYVPSLVLIQ